MNTMKTLMLAGFAALSLGAGTAMAQDGGTAVADFQSRQVQIQADRANADAVQYGASDHAAFAPAVAGNFAGGGF